MVAAKKQLILDCGNCTVLRVAVVMLIQLRSCVISGENSDDIIWTLLPNKWTVRESIYRMNVYDENGSFVNHAYDWEGVVKVFNQEVWDQFEIKFDEWWDARLEEMV